MLIYQRVSFMFFIVVLLFLVKRPWITALAGVMPIFASQANICFDCYHLFWNKSQLQLQFVLNKSFKHIPLQLRIVLMKSCFLKNVPLQMSSVPNPKFL